MHASTHRVTRKFSASSAAWFYTGQTRWIWDDDQFARYTYDWRYARRLTEGQRLEIIFMLNGVP